MFSFFFFFFQAEDGIRDLTVTGVQTCALPIFAWIGPGAAPSVVGALPGASWFGRALLVRALGSMEDPGLVPVLAAAARDPARSEERRVGKECRSRRSPYHLE